MHGAQIGVFEQSHQECLGCLLKGVDGCRLEAQVVTIFVGDFPDQPLERQLSNEKLGRLLVAPDLSQGHGSWAPAARFLDARLQSTLFGGYHGFAAAKLELEFATTGRLARGLFRTGHFLGTVAEEVLACVGLVTR